MQEITVEMREKFLRELRKMPNATLAALRAKIDLAAAFAMRESDDAFRAEWDQALEVGVSKLEEKAIERARKDSDRLMIEMLKALRPEKYSDHSEGDVKVDVDVTVVWDDRES